MSRGPADERGVRDTRAPRWPAPTTVSFEFSINSWLDLAAARAASSGVVRTVDERMPGPREAPIRGIRKSVVSYSAVTCPKRPKVATLEMLCRFTPTVGSNPTVTATTKAPNSRKIAGIRAFFSSVLHPRNPQ